MSPELKRNRRGMSSMPENIVPHIAKANRNAAKRAARYMGRAIASSSEPGSLPRTLSQLEGQITISQEHDTN